MSRRHREFTKSTLVKTTELLFRELQQRQQLERSRWRPRVALAFVVGGLFGFGLAVGLTRLIGW